VSRDLHGENTGIYNTEILRSIYQVILIDNTAKGTWAKGSSSDGVLERLQSVSGIASKVIIALRGCWGVVEGLDYIREGSGRGELSDVLDRLDEHGSVWRLGQ
jgi:hypothetical protein